MNVATTATPEQLLDLIKKTYLRRLTNRMEELAERVAPPQARPIQVRNFHALQLPDAASPYDGSALEHPMAKRSRKSTTGKKPRSAGQRDLVRRPKASAYAKRTARGRFKEMDDIGRSQKTDKPRKAKKTVRSGYGDQGDARPRKRARSHR